VLQLLYGLVCDVNCELLSGFIKLRVVDFERRGRIGIGSRRGNCFGGSGAAVESKLSEYY